MPSQSKLDGLDAPILELLDRRGALFGSDIAVELRVDGKQVGSRLSSLRKRGYVVSYVPANATTMKMWRRTGKAWRDA